MKNVGEDVPINMPLSQQAKMHNAARLVAARVSISADGASEDRRCSKTGSVGSAKLSTG